MDAYARNQTMAAGTLGGANQHYAAAAMNPVPADRPRLHAHLDQLGKMLACCHEVASSLESSSDRLIGPVPEAAQGANPVPPQNNIEQRLAVLIADVEMLYGRLCRTDGRFKSAV